VTGDESELAAFVVAFGEWVEACWFDERADTGRRLDAVLAFPSGVVLVGSLSLLARLVEAAGGGAEDVAAALAQHLIVPGPDPGRQALIRDVVLAAGASPADRASLLGRHDSEAIAGTALECASFLTQVLAERDGVVPSSILEEL
jgi:hypothetical protein